jgi:hypothetical protein
MYRLIQAQDDGANVELKNYCQLIDNEYKQSMDNQLREINACISKISNQYEEQQSKIASFQESCHQILLRCVLI